MAKNNGFWLIMATTQLLFDLGGTPTTRDVANLVKEGGVAALPDAKRRGDDATYQEVRCRSALNRVKGKAYMQWSLNPYRGCTHGCHYCFARRYHSHLELGAGDQFASVIFVKTNFVEVLRRELDKPAPRFIRKRKFTTSKSAVIITVYMPCTIPATV